MLDYEKQTFSQNGEDGILEYLNQFINTSPKTFLEVGWGHGEQNCCRNLLVNHNYTGTGVDGKPNRIHHERLSSLCKWITMNDIELLLTAQGLEPTVFSLDIDSFDWHLLNALLHREFRPKIICHEYNSIFGPDIAVVRKLNTTYNKQHLFGASLTAYKKILEPHYTFITVDSKGINAFWIRKDQQYQMPNSSNAYVFLSGSEYIFQQGIEYFINQDSGWEYIT